MQKFKRKIQAALRLVKAIISGNRTSHPYFLEIQKSLYQPNPLIFPKAIFNFTVDYELIWSNGINGKSDLSIKKRIELAKIQAENFEHFFEMLKKLKMPSSWALVGSLINQKIPDEELQFKPSWSPKNWYEIPSEIISREELWNGRVSLTKLKELNSLCEILTHTQIHADFSDSNMTELKAKWDIQTSLDSISQFMGQRPHGLVFPCNKQNFLSLLPELGIHIVRGSPGQNWCTPVPGLLNTPNGFWLSPGKMTLSELKKLLDISVKHRSFFHPWMHLVECDLNCNDLENFYYPFFSYVKELESKNQISILSFAQIEQQFFSNPQKNLEVNL